MGIQLGNQEDLFNKIKDKSIDAIITDPPYGLQWKHKIETHFNFEKFIENSYRVLKEDGFLVYFGQEPSMSSWNVLAGAKFNYLAEVIWYKRARSNPFQYPLRVHEKLIIFTKNKGKLNKAVIEWENEKEELIDYTTKATVLRVFSALKQRIKQSTNLEELQNVSKSNIYQVTTNKCIVNDSIYNMFDYKIDKTAYTLVPKKLTTLWGIRPHNHQGYKKEEFNIKHPTVKPIQIMERLLEMTTKEKEIVLDPFMGSGTTGIACKLLNRDFIGFELLEEYYKIAEERLNKVA